MTQSRLDPRSTCCYHAAAYAGEPFAAGKRRGLIAGLIMSIELVLCHWGWRTPTGLMPRVGQASFDEGVMHVM